MPRFMLSEEPWFKLLPIMLENNVYYKRSLRLTTKGILYKLRSGFAWRDHPALFVNWNKVYKRFNDWSSQEKLIAIFKKLGKNPDFE